MPEETVEEILNHFREAGLTKERWDKKEKDWIPYYTPLGAAMVKFMQRNEERMPVSKFDKELVNLWWQQYENQFMKNCPRCGSSHFWPVTDEDKKQYFNQWCEDCDFTLEEKSDLIR